VLGLLTQPGSDDHRGAAGIIALEQLDRGLCTVHIRHSDRVGGGW